MLSNRSLSKAYALILFTACSLVSARAPELTFNESVELRRIAEYLEEKDHLAARERIMDFLSRNPESAYWDRLQGILGDMYFQEKNFREALSCYRVIETQAFQKKVQFRKLQCLYNLGEFQGVVQEGVEFLKEAPEEKAQTARFAVAEARFHLACRTGDEELRALMLHQALKNYDALEGSAYEAQTYLPRAHILSALKEYGKASDAYIRLAEKEPKKRAEFLFQAACMQLHVDRRQAAEIFGKICALPGPLAPKAAYNLLSLLFEEKEYRAFLLRYDRLQGEIPEEKLPQMHYCLGKALLHVEDYSHAVTPLSQALMAKKLSLEEEKSALMGLIACARALEDTALFETTLEQLQQKFPQAEETARVLLMRLQIAQEKQDYSGVHASVRAFLDLHPNDPEKETLLYDQALSFIQEKRFEEAATAFEFLIQDYPESAQHAKQVRHWIHARIEDAAHASEQTSWVKKELLSGAIAKALQEEKVFSAREKRELRFLAARMQFELKHYEEAAELFSTYCVDFPKDAALADAYVMLSYCCKAGMKDEIGFVLNAEKALALKEFPELHRTLYNAYLNLAQSVDEEEKEEMMDKAAEHLFAALPQGVQAENRHWLAYYYEKKGEHKRASQILETLIDSGLLKSEQETEVLKLAEMYQKLGEIEKCAPLLESLTHAQKHFPGEWKYHRMATFELAKCYVALRKEEAAKALFEELMQSSCHAPSYFAMAAKVEMAKLELSQGADSSRICNALKEVEIQRKLLSEPLHLEAALSYIEVKSSGDPEKARALLLQMKERFTDESDPLVIEYLSARELYPEKAALFNTYMAFVEILSGSLEESKVEQLEALKKQSTNPELQTRIEQALEALR